MDCDNLTTDQSLSNLEKLCKENASHFDDIKSEKIHIESDDISTENQSKDDCLYHNNVDNSFEDIISDITNKNEDEAIVNGEYIDNINDNDEITVSLDIPSLEYNNNPSIDGDKHLTDQNPLTELISQTSQQAESIMLEDECKLSGFTDRLDSSSDNMLTDNQQELSHYNDLNSNVMNEIIEEQINKNVSIDLATNLDFNGGLQHLEEQHLDTCLSERESSNLEEKMDCFDIKTASDLNEVEKSYSPMNDNEMDVSVDKDVHNSRDDFNSADRLLNDEYIRTNQSNKKVSSDAEFLEDSHIDDKSANEVLLNDLEDFNVSNGSLNESDFLVTSVVDQSASEELNDSQENSKSNISNDHGAANMSNDLAESINNDLDASGNSFVCRINESQTSSNYNYSNNAEAANMSNDFADSINDAGVSMNNDISMDRLNDFTTGSKNDAVSDNDYLTCINNDEYKFNNLDPSIDKSIIKESINDDTVCDNRDGVAASLDNDVNAGSDSNAIACITNNDSTCDRIEDTACISKDKSISDISNDASTASINNDVTAISNSDNTTENIHYDDCKAETSEDSLSKKENNTIINDANTDKDDANDAATDVEDNLDIFNKEPKSENIENEIDNLAVKKPRNASKKQTEGSKNSSKAANTKSSKQQECVVCKKVMKCKYNIVRNGDTKHLCNDVCFQTFRAKPSSFLHSGTARTSKEVIQCTQCRQGISGRPVSTTILDKPYKFCKNACLEEYKKANKHCAECLKVLRKDVHSISASVEGKGVRDFCSSACQVKFEHGKKNSERLHGELKGVDKCARCNKTAAMKHEVTFNSVLHRLCSDNCLYRFSASNNISMNADKCANCLSNCSLDNVLLLKFEGESKHFCCQTCLNAFRTKNKRTVSCAWCNARKSIFEVVEMKDGSNKAVLFCTLNCMSLFRVNLQANSNESIACDQCSKNSPAQYHLTMSDASVRNFCGYSCVMAFQNKFVQQTASGKQVPTPSQQVTQNTAHHAQATSKSPYGTRQSSKAKNVNINSANSTEDVIPLKTIPQVIVQPPPPKQVRNKALLCKPYMQTKATSCRPHVISRPTQTDEDWEPKKITMPCPVPMMVPAPMAMYSTPTPFPILIPIPIPIPCFIPTTRKSASGIMKKIKEMQDRMPSDPFEAELLMMAEAVASAGRESESEYEASDEDDGGIVGDGGSGDVAEDMLQMALRMADMPSEEPMLDLEDAVAPAPVRARELQAVVQDYTVMGADVDIMQNIRSPLKKQPTKRRSSNGGRSASSQRGGLMGAKRSRLDDNGVTLALIQQQAQPPALPEPPADTNFVLKFTYGVNAYKHWVVQKNTQIEAQIGANQQRGLSVRGLKPFKLDVLQSTADELNYALCLFVREVRKPNGEEYAPDSILYLCLGIQEYLYENGRIDNIFTDFFYERFTECLNEVLSRYEVRLNAQGMLVCRIEEEHLWEAKQLGAHSPYVLLNTLVYFNTKHFMLRTPHEHLALSFSHIMKHWKKINCPSGKPGRSVYLRYYSPGQGMDPKRKKEDIPVYEQAENADNPLRCPVKLYEFYLSKCPESIKNRNDVFYLVPERSCVPDSPVWYSTQSMGIDGMTRMLNRLRVVREIQEAHLSAMAPYYT